ncbi:MAG: T9SS type A sorting domain-containing protein [Bacteroidales bacterium]|nr:T9SS type A sorting domain-containing protein [Bacteroidales bacterium]
MKKLLLFIVALLSSGALFAQTDCSDIFMSEYVEGWYNNKALELYNPTNAAITLDNNYRLIRWSNGSATSDQDALYVLPLTGTIAPYKVLVMVQDTTKPGQDTMIWPALRKKATWLAPYDYNGTTPGGNVVFWNGDDAISLQKKQTGGTWKDIDIFGEIGVRPLDWQLGTTGAWTDTKPYWRGTGAYLTKDQTLVRKRTVKFGIDRIAMSHYGDEITGGFPNSFNAFAEYDSLPANFFDSLGFHRCNCETSSAIGKLANDQYISVSPNPVTNSQFTVQANLPVESVEVVSIVGQSVYFRDFTSLQRSVRVLLNANLPGGVYLVKVKFSNNQPVIKKIIVQ